MIFFLFTTKNTGFFLITQNTGGHSLSKNETEQGIKIASYFITKGFA